LYTNRIFLLQKRIVRTKFDICVFICIADCTTLTSCSDDHCRFGRAHCVDGHCHCTFDGIFGGI